MPIAAAARSLALVYGRSPEQRGVLGRFIGSCSCRKGWRGERSVWGNVRDVAYITIDDTNWRCEQTDRRMWVKYDTKLVTVHLDLRKIILTRI
jgi:hypothetical protein